MNISNRLKYLAATRDEKFSVTTQGHDWIVTFGNMVVKDVDLTKAMTIMLATLEPDHEV